jgi:VanZ family protein
VLAHRAFALTWPRRHFGLLFVGSLLVALTCAGIDEGHQHFLPQRTGSLWDVRLDLCGASIGVLAYRFRAQLGGGRRWRSPLTVRSTVSS